MINILFVGDIVGDGGCKIFKETLAALKAKEKIDAVIVNGENSDNRNGISKSSAEYLFSAGADVITGGNHSFRNNDILEMMDSEEALLRPENYSKKASGHGVCIIDKLSYKIMVLNLAGRIYMDPAEDPFSTAKNIISKHSDCAVKIIDFHAEATSEKAALAHYLKGSVSAVLGTHTHIPTADAQIMEGGTAFITDVGMTGPRHSILGVEVENIVQKFITGMPVRFHQAKGDCVFCGILLSVDEKTGKTAQIKPINTI
ncbi:MAG: TIGR00282 family metallophosphoesterase [Oscillospiraceae bacterium]|nr:TIGR00282 family metallophosphoesterase [Oscillospiraceae bacterium]